MLYYPISALINTLVVGLLGFFVIYKNPKSKLNQNLFLMCISVVIWSGFYFIWQIEKNENLALFWCKLFTVGAIWVPIFYFKVVVSFLGIERRYQKFIYIIFGINVIFLSLLLTPYLISQVEPLAGFRFWPRPGFAYKYFLAMFLSISFYSAYLTIVNLKDASPIKKEKIKYMLLGLILSIAGGSTNYFLWYDIPIKPYGNILACTFAIATAYAILRHRLMDIKIVLKQSTVYVLSLFIIAGSVSIIHLTLRRFASGYDIVLVVIDVMLIIYLFPRIRSFLFKFANNYLFSPIYDPRELITEIIDKSKSTLSATDVYNSVYQILSKAFHLKSFAILLFDEKNQEYEIKFSQGFIVEGKKTFARNKELYESFVRKSQPIILEIVKKSSYGRHTNDVIDLMDNTNIEVLAPLNNRDKTIGLMALGPKISGDLYNKEDLNVLQVIGFHIATALENSMLYEEIREWNDKLKDKVEEQTRELKIAQMEKVSQLYRFAEFGKISSGLFHDLVNPITALSLNLELIKENGEKEIGNVKADIAQAVAATKKMENFVMALKNQIRKQSEVIHFSLNQEIDQVISIFNHKARANGAVIEHKNSEAFIIKGDPIKFNQIVSNLISNAIDSYDDLSDQNFREKKVAVRLKSEQDYILLIVEDFGSGIKTEDQAAIFEPFFTTKGVAKGTGIGLSSTKSIVEKDFGGSIEFKSEYGKGSEFIVKIKK